MENRKFLEKRGKVVYYYDDSLDFFPKFVKKLEEETDKYIIIIVNITLNINNVEKVLSILGSSGFHKFFFSEELIVNPTLNKLVPCHRRITDEEISELISRHIKMDTLPKILSSDPVCRWMGFTDKDIIVIERIDGKYYRQVVNDITYNKVLYGTLIQRR